MKNRNIYNLILVVYSINLLAAPANKPFELLQKKKSTVISEVKVTNFVKKKKENKSAISEDFIKHLNDINVKILNVPLNQLCTLGNEFKKISIKILKSKKIHTTNFFTQLQKKINSYIINNKEEIRKKITFTLKDSDKKFYVNTCLYPILCSYKTKETIDPKKKINFQCYNTNYTKVSCNTFSFCNKTQCEKNYTIVIPIDIIQIVNNGESVLNNYRFDTEINYRQEIRKRNYKYKITGKFSLYKKYIQTSKNENVKKSLNHTSTCFDN